ncbi:MAG: phospholipid/cholesterol/gamma-HCH transport system ATP-binding protein [Planctomycetota bacterium]|jgi:phospholipid/cholesterol/gamma-HCH transport system ATP-binding protein
MSEEQDVLVRFDKVTKSFGSFKVLDEISFEVKRGETLVLMGPSGTGKSVTLRHAIGLMQPDSGLVEVAGHDMSTISRQDLAALRKDVGYLFQEGALINWMSVGDNVALPLIENTDLEEDEIRARVEAKLNLVHMENVWDKLPTEISGGMRKRVGLARALITDPHIIFYDEPNAGLDPEISMAVNHLIRELADTLGITSVVITHLVSCVRTVADRVIMLEAGKKVVDTTPEEFLAAKHPRVKRFLGEFRD